MPERPKVGVGVLIFKDGKILLGKRKNAHGEGEWGGPGGHMEFGETIEECAICETKEETGIEIKNIHVVSFSNLMWPTRQYIDIGVVADWAAGEAKICEPDKCFEWKWCDIRNLPDNTFGATDFYIEAIKTGKVYFGTKRMAA